MPVFSQQILAELVAVENYRSDDGRGGQDRADDDVAALVEDEEALGDVGGEFGVVVIIQRGRGPLRRCPDVGDGLEQFCPALGRPRAATSSEYPTVSSSAMKFRKIWLSASPIIG